MSRRRLIFYALVLIGSMCFFGWLESASFGYQRGDRIRVTETGFAARQYATFEKIGKAMAHEDRMTVLQYLYDEDIRTISPGTKGRVIMDAGKWVEVCFDDDGLRNWWVLKESVEAAK